MTPDVEACRGPSRPWAARGNLLLAAAPWQWHQHRAAANEESGAHKEFERLPDHMPGISMNGLLLLSKGQSGK